MANPLAYHQVVKNQQHVFLYCVGGRSSSTAFQRIVNSSNKVWIWGEPHGIIDDTISLINHAKQLNDNDFVKYSLTNMYNSFTNNKHVLFYPNAIGNLESTIEQLASMISNFLKPWAPKIKRFGFKDIAPRDMRTLDYLKENYPHSHVVFCFRNPLHQWPSIHKLQTWSYSKELNLFLDEYCRLANIYLEFASKYNIRAFIENNDLRDKDKLKKIVEYLCIFKIDTALIDVTVSSVKGNDLSNTDTDIILKSDAYKIYLKMKGISDSFYKV